MAQDPADVIVNQDYREKYGFSDPETSIERTEKGLSEEVVRRISKIKNEPKWMLDLRLKALAIFNAREMPSWGADLKTIDFNNITYYLKPTQRKGDTWADVPEAIKKTFDKLGIPEAERKFLGGAGAQYECLTSDTLVSTNPHGPIKIQEIKVGDSVFAYDEQARVLKPYRVRSVSPKGNRPIYAVKAGTRTVKATANHPFLALVDERKPGRRRRRFVRAWRYLSELKPGDLVAIVKQLPDTGSSFEFLPPPQGGRKRVRWPGTTNRDVMWLLGLYLGDGCIHRERSKARVEFAIPATEPVLRAELKRVVREQFGLECAPAEDKYKVAFGATQLARWLEKQGFGGKAATKQVPRWVHGLPHGEVLAFVGGYVDADGYVRDHPSNHDIAITSVNEELLRQVKHLTFACGIHGSGPHRFTSKHPHDPSRRIVAYRLLLAGDTRIDARNPARRDRLGKTRFRHDFSHGGRTTYRIHTDEYIGFQAIKSIKPAGISPVYDIEVDGPHNFVASGILVHNSESVYHNLREDLAKQGVVFLDTDSALKQYEHLFKQWFGKIVPAGDNKFAALNTAVWSGGSFVYIPPGVKVNLPLQAYFRINAKNMGQFERTLIIADEGAEVHYIEGCFVKGTPITTLAGTKPIEEIKVGEKVLTHSLAYKPVYNVQVRKYTGNMHHIRYATDSRHEIKATEEHPILISPRAKAEYKNAEWQVCWQPAKDVKKGDYAVIPIDRTVVSKDERWFATKIGQGGKLIDLDLHMNTDNDFFRLVGYYLAEGSAMGDHYLSFTFNAKEREYIDDVKMLLEKAFGKEPIEYPVYKSGISVVLCSTAAARIFKQEFGAGAHNKHLPGWLLIESHEKQAELIKGWFRGDGNVTAKKYSWGVKRMFRINTVSAKLAEQMKNVLLRLNVLASINVWKRSAPRTDSYVIYAGGSSLLRFADIVGVNLVTETGQGDQLALLELKSVGHIQGDYAFVPITQNTAEYVENIDVYNFSVEDDESYVAHGVVVHNCTAPVYSSDSLHTAVVEVIALKGAKIRYTTIQNWSSNVWNLVTKRAFAYDGATVEWVDGNLGSKVTMKYPSVYLMGSGAKADILSVAFAGKGQHQDAGGKAVHLAKDTQSRIVSKSISKGGGRTSYRGLLRVKKGATGVVSHVRCDALMLDDSSRSDTYPTMQVDEEDVTIAHEATVGKVGEEQLFYLQSRGLSESEALAMVVLGFINEFTKELPMEYAIELNKLIQLEMEGIA